ncbi:MAG TPA: hypothetical protein VK327_15930, partial [Candidatus Paceibacterota bacterium]|nr:hypothetical protein [Candidatus Paceibacterota bacterium]
NLLSELISRDPAFAAKLAQSLAPENGREDALRRVAQEWGVADPEAALAWAEQLPDAGERKSALADATTQLAQTDPAKAVELAELHRLDDRNGLMGNLAMLWAQKDLASALDWAGRQPAGDQKNEIIARLAFVESQTSPLEAANRVVRDIPPGPAQEEAVMSVLNQWANRDFASASAWVERFPEGSFRDRAIAELKGIRASQTPENSRL